MGGSIPPDGQASTWASNAVEEPQVLKYTLSSLHELLTKKYFPNDAKINDKRANLQQALEDYCDQLAAQGELANCYAPTLLENRNVLLFFAKNGPHKVLAGALPQGPWLSRSLRGPCQTGTL